MNHELKIAQKVVSKAARLMHYPNNTEVAVIFVNDQKMRALNRRYRGKDKTTNVLSFPTHDSYFMIPDSFNDLGDIFISIPEARREAKKYGWPLNYEIARLVVHGFLHLLGYNHKQDKQAKKMEALEKRICSTFRA